MKVSIKWLESFETLLTLVVLLIIDIIWIISDPCSVEPYYVFATLFIALSFNLYKKHKQIDDNKPLIVLELRYDSGRSAPWIPPERSSEKELLISKYGLNHEYSLIIRNNSNFIAFNLVLTCQNKTPNIGFANSHNPLNPIELNNPITLFATYGIEQNMTQKGARDLLNNKYPDEIKNLVIYSHYRNSDGKDFYSKFQPPSTNYHNIKSKEINKLKLEPLFIVGS